MGGFEVVVQKLGVAKFSALKKACSHYSSLLLWVLTSVQGFNTSLG